MILVLIIFLSYLLEIALKYYVPANSLFLYLDPMFFVVSLIVYMILYYKKKKTLYFILGCCLTYDFFFGNILFLYTLIFLILYYITCFTCKRIHNFLLTDFLIFIINIILFLILKYIILLWIGYNYPLTFLLNQIIHSITINLLYGLILYYFLGIKIKKN